MLVDKSELFISWHMIIKDQIDVTLRSLDSLQGLYDECLIAVDLDESQDELYEQIKIYPNTFVYRQKWHDRFDLARQDVLDRLSKKATYIGWSDSDEELVSITPREIREYLYNERPPAVNVILRYLLQVGPCLPGDYYRVRMWRTDEPRIWKDSVHEYPAYQGTTDSALATNNFDIVFNHLRSGDGSYRSDFNIKRMMADVTQGGLWRLPRLAGECRGVGRLEESLDFARQGFLKTDQFDIHNDSMNELLLVCEALGDKWKLVNFHLTEIMSVKPSLRTSPFVLEYVALSYYYLHDKELANKYHKMAVDLDTEGEFLFIKTNDRFYT
jgi:hypothetical protein